MSERSSFRVVGAGAGAAGALLRAATHDASALLIAPLTSISATGLPELAGEGDVRGEERAAVGWARHL